jgi:hypothetical protein
VALLEDLRAELRQVANPTNAPAMQAYMKSTMPFLGVASGDMRRVCRRRFATLDLPTAAAWRQAVLGLWRGGRYRLIFINGIESGAGLPLYEGGAAVRKPTGRAPRPA